MRLILKDHDFLNLRRRVKEMKVRGWRKVTKIKTQYTTYQDATYNQMRGYGKKGGYYRKTGFKDDRFYFVIMEGDDK